jgi:hypothetical protein
VADTVVGDIEAAAASGNPEWADLLLELVGTALPAVFAALAGPDTAIEIAAPYVERVLALGVTALGDALSHKPLADVRRAFDDAVGDVLEDVKFGPKP